MPRTPPRQFGAHLEQKNIRTKVDTNTIYKGINSSMHKYSFLFFFLENKMLSQEISLPRCCKSTTSLLHGNFYLRIILSPVYALLAPLAPSNCTASGATRPCATRAMRNSFTVQRNIFREGKEIFRQFLLSV